MAFFVTLVLKLNRLFTYYIVLFIAIEEKKLNKKSSSVQFAVTCFAALFGHVSFPPTKY